MPLHRGRLGLLLGLSILLSGCDEGLKPAGETTPVGSFSGLLTYQHWPPPDSLRNVRIVAFRVYPPPSIIEAVLGGAAAVYPPITDSTGLIPYFIDSLRYTFPVPAGEYQFVVVAQQFGPNVYADWRIVGQYDTTADPASPTPIVVPANAELPNIDIPVDFAHPLPLPPQ